MQILIGETAYEVDAATPVETLKRLIENREFIPADRIRLTLNGRVLEGGTLEFNGVDEDDEIDVGLEVAAGMRAKWRKKRMRRLRRKRRKMRQRAR